MIDLVLRLIDRLIDLAKKREEVNRATFVDFVQPAFQTFEIVHTDYIDSMTRYRARLSDTTLKMDLDHPVFRDIEIDSLKSEHLRIKLTDFRPTNAPEKLRPFLTAIRFYLTGLSVSGDRAEFIDKLSVPEVGNLTEDDFVKGFGGRGRFGELTAAEAYLVVNPSMRAMSDVIFADPLRENLHQKLVGFDAPSEGDVDFTEICQNLIRPSLSESDRRIMCSDAVRLAMLQFQRSYGLVSSAYSALRSELISPS
jgi:hypothetical protein